MKKLILISLLSLFSLSVFAQIPNYVPANGLVGWWPFNSNANDESGNGNNGIIYGAALTNNRFGNSNSAYTFNGSSDYIDLYSTTNILNTINGLQQFSVSYWAFIPTNSTGCIWGHWSNNSGGVGVNCGLKSSFVNGVGFSASNYSGCCEFVQTSFTAFNAWSHVVVVFDSNQLLNSDIIKTYVNGQIISYSPGGIANTSLGNGTSLFIGRRNLDFSSFGDYFLGSVDDIGIWNRVLTYCEIQDLYDSQLGSQSISAGFDQSTCAGDNVTLNGSGGSAYQWNNNVVDGASFAPTQTATYTVSGTDSLGCSGSDTVMVTMLENAANTITQTALDSYTLNGQTYTQSGTYTQTVPAANGCDSVITLNLTLNFTGIHDLGNSTKTLVKITDLNGKIIQRRKNTVMLFIYEDGTVERVVEMEK